MARRRLEVEIIGDARNLNRTLDRTEARLVGFGRAVDRTAKGGGFASMFGGARGLGAIAGGTAVLATVRSFTNAAKDAQVVLGQTSVAVKNAGLSWETNSRRIEAAAQRISTASGFDDEDVARSFQVFVRGQKDVAKSVELSQLAADVARGRYTDLASATQLVNKAAMGQIGALRRAGIQIDKNATSTQALTALQRTFGGAAVKYSNSAAGAADNLAVAWENLGEVAGGPLSTGLARVAQGLTFIVKGMVNAGNAAKVTTATLKDPQFLKALQAMNGTFQGIALLNKLTATTIRSPGEGFVKPPGFTAGGLGSLAKPGIGLVTGVSARLEDQLLNARLSGSSAAIRKALEAQKAFLGSALGQTRLSRGQRIALKEALLSVTDEIAQIDQDAADAAKKTASEIKKDGSKTKAKQRKAMEDALKASKDFQDALIQRADDLKQAALRALDRTQERHDVGRKIEEATAQLALAKRLGSPTAVKQAQQDLADARIDRLRFRLETATVTPTRMGPRGEMVAGAGFTVHIGNLNLPGVKNANDFLRAIQRIPTSTSRRGHHSGTKHGI